jgi:hypothetical protein
MHHAGCNVRRDPKSAGAGLNPTVVGRRSAMLASAAKAGGRMKMTC